MIIKCKTEQEWNDIKLNEDDIVLYNGQIGYKAWVRNGDMIVNRSALALDDPRCVSRLLKNHGLNPREYGIINIPDLFDDFMIACGGHISKDELLENWDRFNKERFQEEAQDWGFDYVK